MSTVQPPVLRTSRFIRELWHQPHRVKGLENTEVERAVGSGVVSLAIARDGSLWAWGKSKRGQLGLGPDITQALAPQQVKALAGQHVAQVPRYYDPAILFFVTLLLEQKPLTFL